MEVLMPSRIGWVALAFAVAGSAATAEAQSVGVAVGSHFRTDYSSFSGMETLTGPSAATLWAFDLTVPLAVASVDVPLTKSVRFQADVVTARTNGSHSSLTRIIDGRTLGTVSASDCIPPRCTGVLEQRLQESRTTVGAGGNLLWRAGTPRVGIFVGAGLGLHRTTGQLAATRICQPSVAAGCIAYPDVSSAVESSRISLAPRVLYGAEAEVAPRLGAFVTFRWGSLGGAATYDRSQFPGTSLTGGMKVALRPEARGLTNAHVDRTDRFALVGALIGTGVASAMWLDIAATRDSCADCEDGPSVASIMGPVAIGAGAGIGALIERMTRGPRRLTPTRTGASVRIAPVIKRDVTGARLGLAW
jgi:hypothetical protein